MWQGPLIQKIRAIFIIIAGYAFVFAIATIIISGQSSEKTITTTGLIGLILFSCILFLFMQWIGYYFIEDANKSIKYKLSRRKFLRMKDSLSDALLFYSLAMNYGKRDNSFFEEIKNAIIERKLIDNKEFGEIFIDIYQGNYYNLMVDSKVVILFRHDNQNDAIIDLKDIDKVKFIRDIQNNAIRAVKLCLHSLPGDNVVYLRTNNSRWIEIFQKSGKPIEYSTDMH